MAVRRVADVAAAGVVGVWAAFFLRSVWSPAAAVVVVLTVGAALLWRRPRVCLAVGLAAVLVAALAGIPTVGDADQWGVAMALLVGVSLGAFESARVAVGGVVLLALAVSRYTAASDVGFVDVGDVSWVACMIGGAAALAGVLTRARRRACAERARVAALAATSPQETALLAVALERERLLDDVHQILRAAISTMLAHAEAADVADPPAATVHAEAVQRVGREAITELRLVLGQLRSPAVASVPPREAPAKGRALGWRRWADRADWWLMPGAVVLAVGDLWIWRASFPRPTPEPTLLSTIVTIAAVIPIALRRPRPLLGAVILGGFLAVSGLLGLPVAFGYAVFLTILTLTWSVMDNPQTQAVAAVAVLLGGSIAYVTLQDPAIPVLVVGTVVTAIGSAGTAHHRGSADSSAAHAADLDRDRRAASAEAVRTQRLAVARDLHDVVSHAVVVMALQAGAAETLLANDPAAARAALERVRAVGSATLTELDNLFAALAEHDTGLRGPVSHDIPALVQRMRAGGLRVDLQVQPGPEPPADPLVYRVIQEALTNTLRHAPQATVQVTITTTDQATTVQVLDDGPGTTPGAARGYGLVGITERVEHAGGHVDTGTAPHGRGFGVLASIPAHRIRVTT